MVKKINKLIKLHLEKWEGSQRDEEIGMNTTITRQALCENMYPIHHMKQVSHSLISN